MGYAPCAWNSEVGDDISLLYMDITWAELEPEESVREQYVSAWAEAFPDAMILMRRSFSHAAKYGLGLYNDMAGEPNETESWLKEIQNGGDLSQTDEKGVIASMPDFWKTAPMGGEFTSSLSMEEMLDTNLSQTVELIRESHTTFLGPNIANKTYQQGYETVLKNMGYRLWVSEASISWDLRGSKLEMSWRNDGVAPFYKDWPVWIFITDEDVFRRYINIAEQIKTDIIVSNYSRIWKEKILPAADHSLFSMCSSDSEEFRFRGFSSVGTLSYVWGKLYRKSFLNENHIVFSDFENGLKKKKKIRRYIKV